MQKDISSLVAAYLAELGLSDPVMAQYYLRGLYQSPHGELLETWLSPEEADEAARLVEIESARQRFARILAA